MSNYMDEDNAGEFRDVPEEAGGEPSAEVTNIPSSTRRVFPTQQTVQLPPVPEVTQEEEMVETEDDYTDVLSDARLRLEQGRLYELVMNSDLFTGSDCDPKAIKNVQKEIRTFARERMEIMLGMKQETSKETAFPMDMFPFNSLEVEALKALASAATKGASQEAEPFAGPMAPPKKNTLTPISVKNNQTRPVPKTASKPLQKQPSTPVKRTKASDAVQRILDEEGLTLDQINQVFDPNYRPLSPEELAQLTPELVERNKQSSSRLGKKAISSDAMPVPSQERINQIYETRVPAETASSNPIHKALIAELLKTKK